MQKGGPETKPVGVKSSILDKWYTNRFCILSHLISCFLAAFWLKIGNFCQRTKSISNIAQHARLIPFSKNLILYLLKVECCEDPSNCFALFCVLFLVSNLGKRGSSCFLVEDRSTLSKNQMYLYYNPACQIKTISLKSDSIPLHLKIDCSEGT